MKKIFFVFPETPRNFDNIIKQSSESINMLKKFEHIIFDMRKVTFITPSALCPLTAYIYFIKNNFPDKKVDIFPPKKFDLQNYLSRMDFFEHLDIDFKKVNKVCQNQSLMELKHITKENAHVAKFETCFMNILENRLNCDYSFISTIGHIVGELINNVLDHSESEYGGFMCAQIYPKKNILEICFSDCGIGIPTSLRNSSALQNFTSDEDCEQIDYSLNFGVTSADDIIKKNTGQGLYFLTKIVKENKGRMKIFSNNGMILIDKNTHRFESLDKSWIGTTVMIELNLNNPVSTSVLDLPEGVDYI